LETQDRHHQKKLQHQVPQAENPTQIQKDLNSSLQTQSQNHQEKSDKKDQREDLLQEDFNPQEEILKEANQ